MSLTFRMGATAPPLPTEVECGVVVGSCNVLRDGVHLAVGLVIASPQREDLIAVWWDRYRDPPAFTWEPIP